MKGSIIILVFFINPTKKFHDECIIFENNFRRFSSFMNKDNNGNIMQPIINAPMPKKHISASTRIALRNFMVQSFEF